MVVLPPPVGGGQLLQPIHVDDPIDALVALVELGAGWPLAVVGPYL